MDIILKYGGSILVVFIKYVIPIFAILISTWSFLESRKVSRIQMRIAEMEEKIKLYDLANKEREQNELKKACVEARSIHLGKHSYKMKFWNSGKAIAYNVDFEVAEEAKEVVLKHKVPYEFLEPNKSFEEIFIVHSETPNKFKLITKWENEEGVSFSKEQMISI